MPPSNKNENKVTTAGPVAGSSGGVATTTKDEMSLGSQESISPRWATDGQQKQPSDVKKRNGIHILHWAGVIRDDLLLAESSTEDNNKILQMSRRFLKKSPTAGQPTSMSGPTSSGATPTSPGAAISGAAVSTSEDIPKVDWEFKTYAVQSQRRMVHAVKFFVYEKLPLKPGSRAKLHGLQSQAFLNNESVRVIEYNNKNGKYLIRPSIPLPEAQKLATTGMLIVDGKNLIASEQDVHIWTFAALYDGKKMTQNMACQFIEKIIIIIEGLKSMEYDMWHSGKEMACQEIFGPILEAQMEHYSSVNDDNALDSSLEYCKSIVQNNLKIVLGQADASTM